MCCSVGTSVRQVLFCGLSLITTLARAQDVSVDERQQKLLRDAEALLVTEPEPDWVRLILTDLELSTELNATSQDMCRRILRALATSGDETAVEHVRSVFENEPERRGMAAGALGQAALQHPESLGDWQLMVRSLTVVEGADAVSVLQGLKRFRLRANKGTWVRQVILTGLQLPEAERVWASQLLQHWTSVPARAAEPWTLPQYQSWFQQEYPEAPPAELPVDLADRRWTYSKLAPAVHDLPADESVLRLGATVFESAGCAKCHRRGTVGAANGPDLTTLGWRRQKAEILRSLLYPSHELDEEYPTVTVVLKNGTTHSGLLQQAGDKRLRVFTTGAEVVEIGSNEVEAVRNQAVSAMPEGTLEPLSQEQIQALMAWLTSVDGVPRPHRTEPEIE
jgi:putative heme-binding domain-containing protein